MGYLSLPLSRAAGLRESVQLRKNNCSVTLGSGQNGLFA
jgi:hypothetical protein